MALNHPLLGRALLYLYPDDDLAHSRDPWVVSRGELKRWPERLGPEPTVQQVEAALLQIESAAAIESTRTNRLRGILTKLRAGSASSVEVQDVLAYLLAQSRRDP